MTTVIWWYLTTKALGAFHLLMKYTALQLAQYVLIILTSKSVYLGTWLLSCCLVCGHSGVDIFCLAVSSGICFTSLILIAAFWVKWGTLAFLYIYLYGMAQLIVVVRFCSCVPIRLVSDGALSSKLRASWCSYFTNFYCAFPSAHSSISWKHF